MLYYVNDRRKHIALKENLNPSSASEAPWDSPEQELAVERTGAWVSSSVIPVYWFKWNGIVLRQSLPPEPKPEQNPNTTMKKPQQNL